MKFRLWLGVLLFWILPLSAQSLFTLSGTVEDFHNAKLLDHALVELGAHSTYTNSKGQFLLKRLPAGTYDLKVSHPDCEPYEAQVTLDNSKQLRVYLEHHASEIEEVLISGTARKTAGHSIETLSKEDLQRLSSENLAGALSTLSGVGMMRTGNQIAKPIIHGLYGSRVGILSSGVRMEEQEWGVEHAPSVEPTQFQTVSVVKGAGMLKYGGDAPGGMILLEPRVLPKKDTLMGRVSLSGISSGKGLKLGLELSKAYENQWYIETTGSYKKLGDLSTSHYTLQNTGAEESAFSFRVGKRTFEKGFELSYRAMNQNFGIFKGAHLGGPEDFYNAIMNKDPFYRDEFSYKIQSPAQEVQHHLAQLEWYQRFKGFGKLSARYNVQLNHRKEFDLRRSEFKGLPSMDLRLITQKLYLDHLVERDTWQLESGISGGVQDNYPNPATKARRLIPDYYRYDVGAYSALKYHLNPPLTLEAGARLDLMRYDAYKYYDQSDWEQRFEKEFSSFVVSESGSRLLTRPIMDYALFSYNASLAYRPWDALYLQVGYSRASRAPSAAELFADGLHHSAAIIEKGDLRLDKEEVDHLSAEVNWNFGLLEGGSLKVVSYLMHSKNFIIQVPTGIQNSNRGVFMVWDYLQTQARIFGLDVDASLGLSPSLELRSTFSTLKGEDITHDEPLILMQPTKWTQSLEWKPSFWVDSYLKLAHEWTAKQKRFPIRNVELSMIVEGQLVNRTLDLSSTPDAYSLWDLSLGKSFSNNFSADFRITNLFNVEYRDLLNRLRYFAPEQGRNFILTLNYQF